MALGLPPMYEDNGKPPVTNSAEGRASDMLSRNWSGLRALRRQYVCQGRYAEAFDLFSIAWMLYCMFDEDCRRLSGLQTDYQQLKAFAGSINLGSVNNAIAHCWCVAVAQGANLSEHEIEEEIAAIAMCLPPRESRGNLEKLVATFASLLLTSMSQETRPEFFFAAVIIEAQTMNRTHGCAEINAVDVDRSDMADLHDELKEAREHARRVGFCKQAASIDKMLALQSIMMGGEAAAKQRYLDLARWVEAQGMGPVFIFDAQHHAFMVKQAMKVVPFGPMGSAGGLPAAFERPEITWYEGFFRRFPQYDWEADNFSAKMMLMAHYGALNDRDKVKMLINDVGHLIPGLSAVISRTSPGNMDRNLEYVADMICGGGNPNPAANPFTPAEQQQMIGVLGLAPQFTEAARNLQFTGIDQTALNNAIVKYFPGAPEPSGMSHQIEAVNRLLGASGLLGGQARQTRAEDVESIERLVEKIRRSRRNG